MPITEVNDPDVPPLDVNNARLAWCRRGVGGELTGVQCSFAALPVGCLNADRTVAVIDAAPAGTHRWRALDLGGSLIGGRSGQATVRFDGNEACKQDLSVTYRGMAALTITGFDICRTDRLYLGKALAKAMHSTKIEGR